MLQARTAAAIGAAVLAAPQFGNREMVRNIADKFHHLNFKPSQLRALVDELCQFDTSANNDAQKRVDERCAAWLHANDGSPEEFYDLRAMNGPTGGNFAKFYEELGRYIEAEMAPGAEERRATGQGELEGQGVTFASKFISLPIVIREVTAALHATPGCELAPVPCLNTVARQFSPNRPSALTSGSFTGRFKVVRQVQTRCLRKEHEDARYVAVLAKYCKGFVCEAKAAALELRMSSAVQAAGLDDKCKIPFGQPGLPVAAVARAHAGGGQHGMLAPVGTILAAADHDTNKAGSLTPSVTFMKNIPEHPADSWYGGGEVNVDLRDSALESSTPILHAANLLKVLRRGAETDECMPKLLWISHDGGSDHNNMHLKVKLSLVALWYCARLQKLADQRGCPNQSYLLTAERAMSLLNLGIQHVSLARAVMNAEFEAEVKSCKNMVDLRHKAGLGPPPKFTGKAPVRKSKQKKSEKATEEAEEEEEEEEDGMEFGEEGGEEAEGVYVVDIIKDKRIVSGLVEYLVAWKGYPNADDDTWEKLATLGAAKEAVQLFESNEQAGAAGLLHAKQAQLRAAWKASVGGAREVVKERFERLELQGKPVKVFDTANEAEVEELHAALKVSAMCTHTSTCYLYTPACAQHVHTHTNSRSTRVTIGRSARWRSSRRKCRSCTRSSTTRRTARTAPTSSPSFTARPPSASSATRPPPPPSMRPPTRLSTPLSARRCRCRCSRRTATTRRTRRRASCRSRTRRTGPRCAGRHQRHRSKLSTRRTRQSLRAYSMPRS